MKRERGQRDAVAAKAPPEQLPAASARRPPTSHATAAIRPRNLQLAPPQRAHRRRISAAPRRVILVRRSRASPCRSRCVPERRSPGSQAFARATAADGHPARRGLRQMGEHAQTERRDAERGARRRPAGRDDRPLAARVRPRTPRGVRRPVAPARRRLGAAHGDRAGAPPLDGALRAARLGQDDARADGRRALAGGLRGAERRCGRARGGARGDRARRPPPRQRAAHADRVLPRRDPPLQQGPAGRAAAGRRGGPRHADRRDDREPRLRGQRRAALAPARVRAAGARARGGQRGAAGGASRRAAAGRRGGDRTSSPRAAKATRARR